MGRVGGCGSSTGEHGGDLYVGDEDLQEGEGGAVMRGGGSVDRGGHASQALLDARGGGLGVVARGGGGAVHGRGGRLDARGVVRAGGGRERGDVGGEARGDPDESGGDAFDVTSATERSSHGMPTSARRSRRSSAASSSAPDISRDETRQRRDARSDPRDDEGFREDDAVRERRHQYRC